MDSAPSQFEPDPIAARLRLILLGLRSVLGMWGLDGSVAVLVSNRAGWIFAKIERMLLRFRAGTLSRASLRISTARGRGKTASRGPALPRRFGWLVIAGKHQAVGYGSQLQHLLAEPEMAALLEASPQARRVLRPLLRALAVELPWTVTQPRPPQPRKARKPRPKPEIFKIPLPRGVITWARREKALEKAKNRLR